MSVLYTDFVRNRQESGLKVNHPASFAVRLNGAKGKMDAKVHSPSGALEKCVVTELERGVCVCVPVFVGFFVCFLLLFIFFNCKGDFQRIYGNFNKKGTYYEIAAANRPFCTVF